MLQKTKRKFAKAWALAEKFNQDDKGQYNATNKAVNVIVGLTVGGLVAAFLIPVALDEIIAVDATAYSSGAESLWNILDLIIVLAVFLSFIQMAMR